MAQGTAILMKSEEERYNVPFLTRTQRKSTEDELVPENMCARTRTLPEQLPPAP